MFGLRRIQLTTCNSLKTRISPIGRLSSQYTSREVRQNFINFFKEEHAHSVIPSSSVVPYGDPSLAFINAGMNQFKPVFLGQSPIPCPRVVNSQKCIRVGGKHNDLDDVGKDGYHHTFFEMLGTWSFNDYFKHEACKMAWQLLTQVYCIEPRKLFITYFGGNIELGLPPDLECREIWLSLGVAEDHILPFGMKENFWEMGPLGPCGPCSEIHVNKSDLSDDVARKLVNQDSEDVVEIWNLVFMQYNRLSPEKLERLPTRHIDTGMGLERLVAFLQKKQTNYETDLFRPLMETIHKVAGGDPYGNVYDMETARGQRDYAYRLLADHARMITIALADGAFPENNHRLRRVIRQSLVTSKKYFNRNGDLMLELCNRVNEMLSPVYPELDRNIGNVRTLFRFEEEIFDDSLEKSSRQWKDLIAQYPELATLQADQQSGLTACVKQLQDLAGTVISGKLAFKLYETYGLQEESLKLLASLKRLSVDWSAFNELKSLARTQTLVSCSVEAGKLPTMASLNQVNLPATESRFKYNFMRLGNGEYDFPPLDATLMAIIGRDGTPKSSASAADDEIIMVADKSNFYTEAGGQIGDTGRLICPTGSARVTRVHQAQGCVFHHVIVTKGSFRVNHPIQFFIHAEDRLNCMANHTATHLLQAALKKILKVTCQKSSHVTGEYLRFDFGVFQARLELETIFQAERLVRDLIQQHLPVRRFSLPLNEAVTLDDVSLVPGEAYPETVHVVKVESTKSELSSVEPCCGTHVSNTADLQEFAILNVRSSGLGNRSIKAVTRDAAIESYRMASELLVKLDRVEDNARTSLSRLTGNASTEWVEQLSAIDNSLKELKRILETNAIPYLVSLDVERRTKTLESSIRSLAQEGLYRSMQTQMEEAVAESQSRRFLVHVLRMPRELLSIGGAKLSLIKATRHCASKPLLVLALDDEGCIVARCTVPKEMATSQFNAEKWTSCLVPLMEGRCSVPKDQNGSFVSNFRSRKLDSAKANELLVEAAQLTTQFALSHL